MTSRTCPDCKASMLGNAVKCRCGWTLSGGANAAAERPVVFCDGERCEKPATNRVGDRNLCLECQDAIRRARAGAFCREQGLRTVDQMRAYCRSVARQGFHGASFEAWVKNMTQRTVDLVVITWGESNNGLLVRLRAAGVIDGRNKLIPLDARELAAQEYRAERARFIVEREATPLRKPESEAERKVAP